MHRIMVDLPEPDGPQITMRSLPMIFRLISRRTWKSPYHLFMPTISTAIGVLSFAGLSSDPWCSAVFIGYFLPSIAFCEASFHGARIARHAVAEDHIEDR